MSVEWNPTRCSRVCAFVVAMVLMSSSSLVIRLANNENGLPPPYIVSLCSETLKFLFAFSLWRRTRQRLHSHFTIDLSPSSSSSSSSNLHCIERVNFSLDKPSKTDSNSDTNDLLVDNELYPLVQDEIPVKAISPLETTIDDSYEQDALQQQRQLVDSLDLDFRASWRYCVPALFYAVDNNLLIIVLTYIDPATFQVFSCSKVIITAILFWRVLGHCPCATQWAALLLLTTGVVLTHARVRCYTHNTNNDYDDDDDDEHIEKNLSRGLILTIIMASASSLANVWLERMYKRVRAHIHLQNTQLYFFGVLINVCVWLLLGGNLTSLSTLLCLAVIVLNASTGLCVSFLLKFTDNIVHVFAHSSSMVFTVIISALFLDFHPSIFFACGVVVVCTAGFIYHNAEKHQSCVQ